MAQDPSFNIHAELLPHVHLISTYRYPQANRVEPGEAFKLLANAPIIAKDRAPFFWTYLEKPSDGTIILTWQPLHRMGTNFATDGYVWAGQEMRAQQDFGNGVVLEMFYYKAGYAPGDQACNHSRRRFRCIPSQTPNAATPPIDPSLWLVCYGPAEPNDRIPANSVPYDDQVRQTLNTRAFLHKAGQIQRKDFMISDRVNWPRLDFPRGSGQGPYGASVNMRTVPQQMAYPPPQAQQPHPQAGPPSKRARHSQSQQAQQAQQPHPQMAPVPQQMHYAPPAAFEDDEDVSQGDLLDIVTPREVALFRFQHNHELMEELTNSPYSMKQIEPPSIFPNLRGLLANLTEGLFEGLDMASYGGNLDPKVAEEFRKRVDEHIKTTQADIEAIKVRHVQFLEQHKRSAILTTAEKELRSAVTETGPESWRLEGRVDAEEEGSGPWTTNKTIEETVAEVEAYVGKKVAVCHDVNRVQAGGFQEPPPEPVPEPVAEPQPAPAQPAQPGQPQDASAAPSSGMSRQPSNAGSQHSGVMIGDSDIDMGGTAAGLLDQMHSGFSQTSTPVNSFPTPQPQLSAIPSSAATPANHNASSPAAAQSTPVQPAHPEDVAMANTEQVKEPTHSAPDQGSSDWVVVPKGGVSPDAAAGASTGDAAKQPEAAAPKPISAAGTPAMGFDGDHSDFNSLGDLDTAGEALAGYDAGGAGELGDGLDLHMDMEDSAFGDAFHGVESSHTPGEN